jgi:hypothetical protein
MTAWRFAKTPKLGIVLQITEVVPSGIEGKAWHVHDVERNRGFRVTLTDRALADAGAPPAAGVGPGTDALDDAIGLAVERALVTPPEKVAGTLDVVDVTSQDVRASLGR